MQPSSRVLRWTCNDARFNRIIKSHGNTLNLYNGATAINTTKSFSSKVPFHSDLSHLANEDYIAKNTFLSGFDEYGIRSQANLASRIRGSFATVQKYQNAHHIFHKEALVYHCKYFKLNYYPPEHFLGLFRKTSPSVNVRESGEAPFNNNLPIRNDACWNIFRNNQSFFPKHYAIYRRLNRIFIKRQLVTEWCRLNGDKAIKETFDANSSKTSSQYLDQLRRTKPGIAKDGFYVYMSLIFPDENNQEDLAHHVRQSVVTVANLQWDKFLKSNRDKSKTWVQKANSCIKLTVIKKILSGGECNYALSRFSEKTFESFEH